MPKIKGINMNKNECYDLNECYDHNTRFYSYLYLLS